MQDSSPASRAAMQHAAPTRSLVRRSITVATAALALAAMPLALTPLASTGCGGASCGNGKVETGEQCDNGPANGTNGNNCSSSCQSISILHPEVNVKWDLLDMTGVMGFSNASCFDFSPDATQDLVAHVQLSGPSPADRMLRCSDHQHDFVRVCTPGVDMDEGFCPILTAGQYTATVTLLAPDGVTPVTKSVTSMPVDLQPGSPKTIDISFGMSDFLKQDYTGSLYFYLSWGSDMTTCAAAAPPVTIEKVTLVRDGETTPVAVMTKGGNKLDGSGSPCFTGSGNTTYEEVDNLPWGKYHLTAESGDGKYQGSFDVYVKPGVASTTFNLTVPPFGVDADAGAPADGAVDGGTPPDAPMADSAGTDGGVPVDAALPDLALSLDGLLLGDAAPGQ